MLRASAILLLLAACSSTPPTTWTEQGPVASGAKCNPLAPEWDCLYPWPSDFYLAPDAKLPSGHRVEPLPQALPTFDDPATHELMPVDFFAQHPADGFSIIPQIAVRIPGGVDLSQLVFHTGDLAASQKPTSRTLLVDAETGELVLHFAEQDVRPHDVDDRALMIRPLIRLKDGHRYVVALQGLTHPGGAPIEAPSGFKRIRDGAPEGDLETRLVDYFGSKVFPVLKKLGVDPAKLVLAWDFTTETQAQTTGDMLEVRRLAMAQFEVKAPEVRITDVRDLPKIGADADPRVAREILGIMKVPNFLERDANGNTPIGGLLHRGADGKPAQDGTLDVPFAVRIGRNLWEDATRGPGRVIQYGHGFFGSYLELRSPAVANLAADLDAVVVGTEWMGMAQSDAVGLLGAFYTDPSSAMNFVDRTHQGMVNFIALNYVARKVLPSLPELQRGGASVMDGSRLYYHGISQGHILGTTYTALAPAIDRAALQVGGVAFGFMMSRAHPFRNYLDIMEVAVGSTSEDPSRAAKAPLNAQKLVLLLQTVFDRVDPATYLPHLLKDTYPGSPASRKILMQIGVHDAQVPNLASHIQARSLGLSEVQPAPREIFGVLPVQAPFDGSAIVEFDFHAPEEDLYAEPAAEDNVVHEGVRKQKAVRAMIDRFLRPDGKIEMTCEGVCDPE